VVNRAADERGAGAVIAVAMMGLVVTVTVAVVGVVGVVATHRRVQSAADLAALAGATALQDGGDACARAADVATRNRATLSGCAIQGWNVAVVVSAHNAPLPRGLLDLSARGRAGPAVDEAAP